MKKTLCLMLALLMLLSLAACGGSEQPQTTAEPAPEASATPETAACAHNWAEASCAAPESCTLCGDTRGEALPHSFELWSFTETEMSRSCTLCGESEAQALDYKAALNSYLEGRLNFLTQAAENEFYDAYSCTPGSYTVFGADGTGTLRTPVITEGSFTGFIDTAVSVDSVSYDGKYGFSFALVCEDGSILEAQYQALEKDQGEMAIIVSDTDYLVLRATPAETRAMAGTWVCPKDGELMILELKEDGTVSGTMNCELSGEWHAIPADRTSDSFWDTGFSIIINRGGVWDYSGCSIQVDISDASSYEQLAYGISSASVNLSFGDDLYTFIKIEESRLEELKAAHEENRDAIVGTWTTDYYSRFDTSTLETFEGLVNFMDSFIEESGDFAITFNADGTFSSNMPGLEDGSWSYCGTIILDSLMACDYDAVFNGEDSSVSIYKDDILFPDSSLHMSYRYAGTEYLNYELTKSA